MRIGALGCFMEFGAASGVGPGGVAQDVDFVVHGGGQPFGAVLDGAQGADHHIRIAQAFWRLQL